MRHWLLDSSRRRGWRRKTRTSRSRRRRSYRKSKRIDRGEWIDGKCKGKMEKGRAEGLSIERREKREEWNESMKRK